MSIFGSPIKEPKNFDAAKFFKTFKKMNGYDIIYSAKVITKDEDPWRLNWLLVDSLNKGNKSKVKALEKLVETGAVVNRDNKEIVLDAEFMTNVVKPVAYAKLNPDEDLSKQILKIFHKSYGACDDVDFYNSLTDEEAKLVVIRSLQTCGSTEAVKILDSAKELVLNSKFATLEDIYTVFACHAKTLSKEEFNTIWGKLKPRLLKLSEDDFMPEYKTSIKGVKYVKLFDATDKNGHAALKPERYLLEKICEYLRGFIPEFNSLIQDEIGFDSGGAWFVDLWMPYKDYGGKCEYLNREFVEKVDDTIQFKLPAAMEKDTVKKLQLEKESLDKKYDAEIQAIKDFVAARKVKIQDIKSKRQEIEGKLKAIEEENKRKETERARAELQKKQAEFEALAAKLGVNPADLLALQQKAQQQKAIVAQDQKQY
jgi:hypothetical protein